MASLYLLLCNKASASEMDTFRTKSQLSVANADWTVPDCRYVAMSLVDVDALAMATYERKVGGQSQLKHRLEMGAFMARETSKLRRCDDEDGHVSLILGNDIPMGESLCRTLVKYSPNEIYRTTRRCFKQEDDYALGRKICKIAVSRLAGMDKSKTADAWKNGEIQEMERYNGESQSAGAKTLSSYLNAGWEECVNQVVWSEVEPSPKSGDLMARLSAETSSDNRERRDPFVVGIDGCLAALNNSPFVDMEATQANAKKSNSYFTAYSTDGVSRPKLELMVGWKECYSNIVWKRP